MARDAGAKPLEERRHLKKILSGEIEAISSPVGEESEGESVGRQHTESPFYNKIQQIKL
jgi:hypothetical protein